MVAPTPIHMPQAPAAATQIFPRAHLPALDGLRGWAVLMVVFAHLATEFHSKTLASLASQGVLGVDLFFVLSGFLITGILLDAKGQSRFLRNFYARRVLRIWPIYFLLVAVVFIASPRLGAAFAFPHSYYKWEYYLLFMQNILFSDFGPIPLQITWSLGVEEQFYLVWPLVVLICSSMSLRRVLMLLVVSAPLVRLALYLNHANEHMIYMNTFCRTDGLALGGLLALWTRSEKFDWGKLRKVATPLLPIAAVVSLVVMVAQWKAPAIAIPLWNSAVGVFFVACLGLVLCLSAVPAWWSVAVNNPVLRHLGKISYGLYIYHCLIFWSFRVSPLHLKIVLWEHHYWGDLAIVAIDFALACTPCRGWPRPSPRAPGSWGARRAGRGSLRTGRAGG